jgi:hypothetical protein
MNVFVLKGVLLDASRTLAEEMNESALKDRVFESISYPGFINSTYDIIGVEFGLGITEIDAESTDTNEDALVKIQVWNLNEQKNFVINWKNFLKGSRFAIITWSQQGEIQPDSLDALASIIRDCLEKCPEICFGLILHLEDSGKDIKAIFEHLQLDEETAPVVCSDLDGLMKQVIVSCISTQPSFYVLPVLETGEVRRVDAIQNPFSNYQTRASENLVDHLKRAGYFITPENQVYIEKEKYIFKLNLNNSTLNVAARACKACDQFPCREAFAKICIVLDSQVKKGFASNDFGFTNPDLFMMSIIYSIDYDTMPSSVTSQFPKIKPCTKRR